MKFSVYIAASLDGFISRENGGLDWLPGPEEGSGGEDYGFQEFLDSVDVLVMGRNTYEAVISFGKWPYGNRRVIVLTSKKAKIPEHLTGVVEARSCSPVELYKELSETEVKRVYIDGGKTVQSFLNAGLINEIIITRVPILIGKGIPLFGPVDNDIKLRHLETRSFENGFVQSKYEIVK
jgi:dihydrofolate reductase